MKEDQSSGFRKRLFLLVSSLMGSALIIVCIAAIVEGVFDPIYPYVEQDLKFIGQFTVTKDIELVVPITNTVSSESNSYRLVASKVAGESDIAYGIILESGDSQTILAINPVGYVSFWQRSGKINKISKQFDLISWHTWPHVNKDNGINEIWLSKADNKLTDIRINQELLWRGDLEINDRSVGIWATSYGEEAVINFHDFRIFSEE